MKKILYTLLLLTMQATAQNYDWCESWYFGAHEFKCKCGASGEDVMNAELIRRLNVARFHAGFPFYISSGYRTHEHNQSVRGARHSSHVSGHGVDIYARNDRERYLIIKALIYAGFTRIGVYPSHIHVDNSPINRDSVLWVR